MKTPSSNSVAANVLVMALATILVLSAVGATVLANLNTRYNVSHTQVRGWKNAQHAAEAAGDIAYAEIRKVLRKENPGDPDAFAGWELGTEEGDTTWKSPLTTFGPDGLVGSSTVRRFGSGDLQGLYRIRTRGTARLPGLKRVGMDNRLGPNTRGDNLLRKIDFNYDHFIASYGPNGDGVGKALVPVAGPQLTRRLELIAAPVTPFDAAIKARGLFEGLGDAALIDSYDSTEGPYGFFAESRTHPRYPNSRSGHVQINDGTATIRGKIYGDVATNGGIITGKTSNIYGTIDNNVPFTLPPFVMPSMPPPQTSPTSVSGSVQITPPAPGTVDAPTYYSLSSFANNGKLQVNPRIDPSTGQPVHTYVAVRVNGDIGTSNGDGPEIIVSPNVTLQVFFTGNFQTKADNIKNQTGYAGNLQFYGISPTDPSVQQTVDLNSGGGSTAGFSAVFYTPSAKFTINGAPDITGSIICKNFYGNGNVTWHYDRRLGNLGAPVDFRIASYVEDIR